MHPSQPRKEAFVATKTVRIPMFSETEQIRKHNTGPKEKMNTNRQPDKATRQETTPAELLAELERANNCRPSSPAQTVKCPVRSGLIDDVLEQTPYESIALSKQ